MGNAPFEAFSRRDGHLYVEDLQVADIVSQVGTPVYLYSGGELLRAYAALDEAFHASPHLICYSIKANMNLAVVMRVWSRK